MRCLRRKNKQKPTWKFPECRLKYAASYGPSKYKT